MINPVLALLITVGVFALAWVLFWPGWGLFWRWMRAMRVTERVRMEDALKHLYDCEYCQRPCTLYSLSGATGLSADRATELLSRLVHQELVSLESGAYQLTPAGRSYALRVIRAHRLWECYLSDETGLKPLDWHREADYREHTTSSEEINVMLERMGHPRFDPHGDPIPTESGDMGPPRGQPLTEFPVGKLGEIAHIEDEPTAIYSRLVAEGLHPGMRVRVLEVLPRRIRFQADGQEYMLAPVVVANLSILPLPEEQEMEGPFEPLSGLNPGQKARVVGISALIRGIERRRILDLGILPGTVVKAELQSPGGDPTAYRIRGSLIALRKEQADLIHVNRLEEGGPA